MKSRFGVKRQDFGIRLSDVVMASFLVTKMCNLQMVYLQLYNKNVPYDPYSHFVFLSTYKKVIAFDNLTLAQESQ